MSSHLATCRRTPVDPYDAYLQRSYFPELDGLRALCALLVITAHLYSHKEYWTWLAGDRGVSIFFVLSGYLITTLALREEQTRGRLSLAAFYVRRCFRLFPLYYLVLGFYAFFLLFLGRGSTDQCEALAEALPWNLLYCSEVPFYKLLVLEQRDLPFFQSWSLGIEEKFYLVWPFVAFVCWHGRRSLRLYGTTLLAAGFAGVSAVLLCDQDAVWRVVGRFLHSFYPILVGCLAAFLLHERSSFLRLRRLALWGRGVPALICFSIVHLAGVQVDGWLRQGVNLLYPLATTALLLVLLNGEGLAVRFFRLRPLVFVGRLSYGVYLLHLLAMGVTYRLLPGSAAHPLLSLLAFVVCSLLSIGGAWLLSRTIEAPCIRLGRRWSSWLRERSIPTPVAAARA